MAFLHSTPDDLRLWMHQKGQHFAAWYRCIAIDAALTLAFEGNSWQSVRSVRLEPHHSTSTCWLHGDGACVSALPVQVVRDPQE